jgi:ABC-type branched-subunit amino acid transport system substrate-binding protein
MAGATPTIDRRALVRRARPFHLTIALTVIGLVTGLTVPFVRADDAAETVAAGVEVAPGVVVPGGTVAPGQVPTGPAAGGGPAGSGPSTATGGPARAGTAAPGAVAQGDEPGVTDDQVKLGIALIDVGAAKDFGFNFDLGDQRGRYDALIAAQNAKGGIHGRRIVADYRTIDAANPAPTGQAACVGWTKDAKVFSVLIETNLTQSAAVCLIGPGATPVFTTDGIDASYYANGLYFSTQASDNRILADHAAYLIERGVLQGKTIGVLGGEGAEKLSIDNTLIPALARGGFKVATVEVVPGTTAGTQRLPIAVSNLKAAGVDYLIIAANVILAGPFVQAANRAGFNPQYSLSDFNNQINDQVASYYPEAFDGTIGLSTHNFPGYRAGLPVPPADQACFDRVAKADPKVLPFQNSAHEVGLGECAIFDAWVRAALAAGPNLTRASLVGGAESSGRFDIPGTFEGSFGRGKHDAVDVEREVAWRKDCKCWKIVDGAGLRRMAS